MIGIRLNVDTTNVDKLIKNSPSANSKILKDLAEDTKNFIKGNWSPSSPSDPGEPPAVVTGKLDASIEVDKQGRSAGGQFASGENASHWYVRSTDEKAAWLEIGTHKMQARPFFLPGINWAKDQLPERYKSLVRVSIYGQ